MINLTLKQKLIKNNNISQCPEGNCEEGNSETGWRLLKRVIDNSG